MISDFATISSVESKIRLISGFGGMGDGFDLVNPPSNNRGAY